MFATSLRIVFRRSKPNFLSSVKLQLLTWPHSYSLQSHYPYHTCRGGRMDVVISFEGLLPLHFPTPSVYYMSQPHPLWRAYSHAPPPPMKGWVLHTSSPALSPSEGRRELGHTHTVLRDGTHNQSNLVTGHPPSWREHRCQYDIWVVTVSFSSSRSKLGDTMYSIYPCNKKIETSKQIQVSHNQIKVHVGRQIHNHICT